MVASQHRMRPAKFGFIWCLGLAALVGPAAPSFAAVTIFGGPIVTPHAGEVIGWNPVDVNSAGMAFGWVSRGIWEEDLVNVTEERPFRWDSSGAPALELASLGSNQNGASFSTIVGINDAGTVIGTSRRFNASGLPIGDRPVRWDLSGNVTELASLGTSAVGVTSGRPSAINSAGTIVGRSDKYDSSGKNIGYRAVRWSPSGEVTKLDGLVPKRTR